MLWLAGRLLDQGNLNTCTVNDPTTFCLCENTSHKEMQEVKSIKKDVPSLLCLLAQEEWSFLRNRTLDFASMFSSASKYRSSCQLHCFASLLDREHILFLEIRKSIMQTLWDIQSFSYWLDWGKIKGSHESAELLRGKRQIVLHASVRISTP